jgi:hypothetical protein
VCITLALAITISGQALALRAQEVPSPELKLARDFGLARLANTNIWITQREARLRDDWNELPPQRESIAALETELANRVEQNARQWALLEERRATLMRLLAALTPADKQRRAVEDQLKSLARQGIAPERLGDQPDVRAKVMELINRRNQLWLTAQAIRRNTPKVAAEYERLKSSPSLNAAITLLGNNHRLGPARDYEADLKRLADFERIYLTVWVPLYQQGERLRLTLLAGETTPLTFTWTSSPEPTVITSAMAEAIGVEIPSQAAQQMVTLAPMRTYAARRVKIPLVRLGSFETQEVEAWVLPPEGEDLGARIGPAALSGVGLEAQPERLRLLAKPKSEPAPDKSTAVSPP